MICRRIFFSSAGALGIAQFMPETASDRGLDNPFDPLQAIPASARLLRDMAQKFGNLGLAAAAYNAGPRRIEDWLAKRGPLPQETQAYVRTITSWPAETWTAAQTQTGIPAIKVQRQARIDAGDAKSDLKPNPKIDGATDANAEAKIDAKAAVKPNKTDAKTSAKPPVVVGN